MTVNLGTLDTKFEVMLGGAAARMVEPGQGQDSRKGDNVYGYLELLDIEAKTMRSAEGKPDIGLLRIVDALIFIMKHFVCF